MRRRLLGIGLAALLGMLTAGGPAAAQSLTEALAEAYRTNPQLPSAANSPKPAAPFRRSPAATPAAPGEQGGIAVGIGGRAARGRQGADRVAGLAREGDRDLTATQQIYRGGRTEAQVRQAINTVEATRAQTLAVETTVFQAVAQAYLDVVRDQNLVAVNRNNEYVLGQEFESTRIRAEIGELTGTDMAQVQSSLGSKHVTVAPDRIRSPTTAMPGRHGHAMAVFGIGTAADTLPGGHAKGPPDTEDHREAAKAFVEKRTPIFIDR
jgi:outer membrane protein